MTQKGRRRMVWTFIAIVLVAGAAWAALQFAIARNGPAVLDIVDRVTGGNREVELVHQATFGNDPFQKIRVYRGATSGNPEPVLIFIHGGSWRSGNPDNYGFVARALVPEGFVVVLAGYRLGADGEFPGMVRDAAQAVAWTKANAAGFGGDPDTIFLSGHSAGAYNAAMIALDPQWLADEGVEANMLAGVIGLAGPYDFYPFDTDSTKAAFGDAPDPLATQPVNFARAEASPMLLMTGAKDTTVKPRNSRVLAETLTDAGGMAQLEIYKAFDHSGILTALASPWRRDAAVIDRITQFTDAILAKRRADTAPASVPVQPPTR